MSRFDAVGLYWEDIAAQRIGGRIERVRPMPPIPDTGWHPPVDFPNLAAAKIISIDTETKDLNLTEKGPGGFRGDGHIVGIAVGADDDGRWYFPMRHEVGGGNMDPELVLRWARDHLTRPNQPKVGANLMYDLEWLAAEGVEVAGPFYDVQLAEPLLDENAFSYSLETLAKKYCGEGKTSSDLYQWCADAYGGAPTGKQRANIYRAPAALVGPYAQGDVDLPLRILQVQRTRLAAEELSDLFDLESRLIPLMLAMRRRGVRINLDAARGLSASFGERIAAVRAQWPGLDPWSGESIARLCDKEHIAYPRTGAGNPSFRGDWLKQQTHPMLKAIAQVRKLDKADGTFIKGYVLDSHVNGRIYASFHQLKRARDENDESGGADSGTVSGRFCVHGSTLLETSRGVFTIAEYIPQVGDTIETHRGRQRRILRKINKGMDEMVEVLFSSGQSIKCTGNHRLLTPLGWENVKSLKKDSKVYCRSVFKRSESPDVEAITNTIQSQCSRDQGSTEFNSAEASNGTKENTIFQVQGRKQKSYEGEGRGASSQLERCYFRWARLFNRKKKRQTQLQTSSRDEKSIGSEKNTERLVCTSHRWKSSKQQYSQFSVNDNCGAPSFALTTVVSITPVGASTVWDIEVEEDHSYIAQGLIHHNSSSNPNLQNIPARDDELRPLIRGLYLPDEDEDWVSLDWSQIEFRLLVHYGVGPSAEIARRLYHEDPTTDFHVFVSELTGIDRKPAKNINFGLVYGMGKPKLARQLGRSREATDVLFAQYHSSLPFVRDTFDAVASAASNRGWIKTYLGRRRRFDLFEPRNTPANWAELAKALKQDPNQRPLGLTHEAAIKAYGMSIRRAYTHKALNALMQGGAADIMKKAMVMIWESGVCNVLGAPLLTVHDELDWSVPRTPQAKEAVAETKRIMENCVKLRVPLTAEMKTGLDWGHVK